MLWTPGTTTQIVDLSGSEELRGFPRSLEVGESVFKKRAEELLKPHDIVPCNRPIGLPLFSILDE